MLKIIKRIIHKVTSRYKRGKQKALIDYVHEHTIGHPL